MQAKASQISAILGGKMPHVMTLVPGGTAFVPTDQKLDDLKGLVDELYNWVAATMIPDTLAIAPYYADALTWGKGCGRYNRWGVFENQSMELADRYLPMGVVDDNLSLSDVQENLITEYMGRSWYKGSETYTSRTSPPSRSSPPTTWRTATPGSKCPAYDGKPYEAGGLARILAAYKRGVPFVKDEVDGLLEALGAPGQIGVAQSTLGRTAVRQVETLYIAGLMKEWVAELVEAVKSGDSEYFREPATITGAGTGFWRPPVARSTTARKSRTARSRLPDHHPVHVEPGSPQRRRRAWPARAGAHRRSGGRCGEAHQRPAHGPQLRPVHGVRRPCHRAGDGQELRDGHEPLGGEVTWRIGTLPRSAPAALRHHALDQPGCDDPAHRHGLLHPFPVLAVFHERRARPATCSADSCCSSTASSAWPWPSS